MEAISVTKNGELYSGWLQKKAPSGLVRSWKNRFFVLQEEQLDAVLRYYTTDDEAKQELKGTVNLNEVLEIRNKLSPKSGTSWTRTDPDIRLRFEIVMTSNRIFELCAPNRAQKNKWCAMISQASNVPVASAEGSDDAYLVRGYLLKLSGGLNSRAKYDRRFIRLRNDEIARHIQYFDTAGDSSPEGATCSLAAPRGTILLSDVIGLRRWSHETSNKAVRQDGLSGWMPDYTRRFEVITRARTFVFAECGAPLPTPSSGPAATSEKRSGSDGAAADDDGAAHVSLREEQSEEGGGNEGDANAKEGEGCLNSGRKDDWLAKLSEACEVPIDDAPKPTDGDKQSGQSAAFSRRAFGSTPNARPPQASLSPYSTTMTRANSAPETAGARGDGGIATTDIPRQGTAEEAEGSQQ